MILTMMMEKRFHPTTLAARELLAQGQLGDVVLIAATGPHKLMRAERPPWMFERSAYGGIINDLAIHDIDLFLALTGGSEGELCAYAGNRANQDLPQFEDYGLVVLRSDDGIIASIEVNWLSPEAAPYHGDYRMRLTGTHGTAELLWKDEKLVVATHERPPWEQTLPPGRGPAQDFFDALAKGRNPSPSGAEVIAATRVALVAQESADSGSVRRWRTGG